MNMLSICIAPLVLGTAALQPAPTCSQADPVLIALTQVDDASLSDLRGGAPEDRIALDDQDLATLRAAEATSTDLANLRGGVMDDHDLTVIAVVALVIIALVLIL